MEKRFNDVMDRLFNDLNHEMFQVEGELSSIKDVDKKMQEETLKHNDFEKYETLIGVMYTTSHKLRKTLNRMHEVCILANKRGRPTPDQKRDINSILNKIKEFEKLGLANAERLPFSIDKDGGWFAQGEISMARKIINIPGYLLVAPFLLTSEKARAMYNKSLSDIKSMLSRYRRAQQKDEGSGRFDQVLYEGVQDSKKELKDSMKDLKIFIRNTNRLHRNLRTLKRDCKKLYKNLVMYIDEAIIYGVDEVDRKAA